MVKKCQKKTKTGLTVEESRKRNWKIFLIRGMFSHLHKLQMHPLNDAHVRRGLENELTRLGADSQKTYEANVRRRWLKNK